MGLIQEFFAKIGDAIDSFLGKFTDNVIIKSMIKVGGFFLLVIIIIVLFASCGQKRTYTRDEFLAKMVSMTKAKYKKSDQLPKEDKGRLVVSLQSFVDDKTIKDVSSMLTTKDTNCTGAITIINNNGYYLYIPELECGTKYKTTTLYDTLVTDDNIVEEGNGLYDEEEDGYIYRGDDVNNFISLNDTLYRVLRINKDKTVRVLDLTKKTTVVWDNRYNVDKKSNVGINNYFVNGINSRLKDSIEADYEALSDDEKPFFATTEVCVGKRSVDDNIFDTSVECSETIDSYPFTLLNAYEYFLSSLDENCTPINSASCGNYNYLNQVGATWCITADRDTTYMAYKLNNGVSLVRTSTRAQDKIVTTLNGELIVEKGTGTEKDPYVIRTFLDKKKR